VKVTIDLRGVQEAFRRAPQIFYQELDRSIKQGLTDIQRDARRVHRFKSISGNLARSVQVDFTSSKDPGNGLRLDKGMAPYAGWVHEGTQPHRIYPKDSSALAFIGKDGKAVLVPRNMGYIPTRAYWRDVAKKTGATLVYKGYVQHPGTKPDQFLYQAADRGIPGLMKRISAGIGRAIKRAGLGR